MFLFIFAAQQSVSYTNVLDCCSPGLSATDEVHCLKSAYNSSLQSVASLSDMEYSKIVMFSYSTANILEYGLYSFAINSVFASAASYSIYSTSPMGGFEFDNRDQRWNKVKIMTTFLSTFQNKDIVDGSKYLVWFDTDLIVLDFNLRFEKFTSMYPDADLIISKDVEPLNGMANTGCMIVRNTAWARAFFQQWWSSEEERLGGMDQHVFDRIYNSRYRHRHSTQQPPHVSFDTGASSVDHGSASISAEVSETIGRTSTTELEAETATVTISPDGKIVLLPSYALNSHIPARRHQRASHQVLHLAGESTVVRSHIFRRGFREICKAHHSHQQKDASTPGTTGTVGGTDTGEKEAAADTLAPGPLHPTIQFVPAQLGLTRAVLQSADQSKLLIREVEGLLLLMASCATETSSCTFDQIDEVSGFQHYKRPFKKICDFVGVAYVSILCCYVLV
jgi:hypothetical protein